MIQKIKDWLVDLLGGYTREEIFYQRALFEEAAKERNRFKERLEIIEKDLKINDASYYRIEYIASHLCKALEIIKQKEARNVNSEEYELESLIFAISRSVECLLKSKENREIKVPCDTTSSINFLNQYEYFKTSEWKKKESIQFNNGDK